MVVNSNRFNLIKLSLISLVITVFLILTSASVLATTTHFNSSFIQSPTITCDTMSTSSLSVTSMSTSSINSLPWTNMLNHYNMQINVLDYGAVGDGTTDDTAHIQAALNAALPGQTVFLPVTGKYLIDSANLNIPKGVTLCSTWSWGGSTTGPHAALSLSDFGGALIVNPLRTITLSSCSTLRNVPIYRKGLSLPETNANNFAGTAITISGDDAGISHVIVLGFNYMIWSDGYQRQQIEYVNGDNTNGLHMNNQWDFPIIQYVHLWPYCTYPKAENEGHLENYHRSGVAFDVSSSTMFSMDHCFCFDYQTGYRMRGVDAPKLFDCIADGIGQSAGSVGFEITGGTTKAILQGCTGYSIWNMYHFNTTSHAYIEMVGCDAINGISGSVGINLEEGDLQLIGGCMKNVAEGVVVGHSDCVLKVDGTRFDGITQDYIYDLGGSPSIFLNVDVSQGANGTGIVTGGYQSSQNPSGSVLTISPMSNIITVTGNTGFGLIGSGWANRCITLIFQSPLTVYNGIGGAAIRLNGSSNFNTQSGSTLTLVFNGTQWLETSRSV